MKQHVKVFAAWLRDAGSWLVLLLSASTGIIVAGFPHIARRNLTTSKLVATIVVSVFSAGGIVTFEAVRKSDRTMRSLHLWSRISKSFMAGLGSVALADSIFEFITQVWGD